MDKVIYVVFDKYENKDLPDSSIETNKVYRCLTDGKDFYRIETPKYKQGIIFDSTESEEDYAQFKFREISIEDLFEMDVDNEEVEKIIKWEQEENKDIFNIYQTKITEDDIKKRIEGSLSEMKKDSEKIFEEGTESFNYISSIDPIYQESLLELFNFVKKEISKEFDSKNISEGMREDPRYGFIVNTYLAMSNIQEYIDTKDPKFLLSAIHKLIEEINRNKIYQ